MLLDLLIPISYEGHLSKTYVLRMEFIDFPFLSRMPVPTPGPNSVNLGLGGNNRWEPFGAPVVIVLHTP